MLVGWLLLTFNFNKTPLGETGCLSNPYFLLTGCLGFQFLIHLHFTNTISYLWLPTPHWTALVFHLTGKHAISLVINFLFSREAEDFTRDGKHSKHVPLLTYLAWLQAIINILKLIFNYVKTKDAWLVLKLLMKKTVATLISSR